MRFLFASINSGHPLASGPVSRRTHSRGIVKLGVYIVLRWKAGAPVGWPKVQPPPRIPRGNGRGVVICAGQILDQPCVCCARRRRRKCGCERGRSSGRHYGDLIPCDVVSLAPILTLRRSGSRNSLAWTNRFGRSCRRGWPQCQECLKLW